MRYGKTATDMGYIPENEGDFLQQMFVCNPIMIIMIRIILRFSIVLTILGLFAQLWTVSECMEKLCSNWMDFHEI
jgi:hypothetical protein